MLKDKVNSKKQGDVGLGVAIGWLSVKGYTVNIPLTDSQDYDLIVDINGKLFRVQVKTTYCINKYGRYALNLTVSGGNKSSNSVKKFVKYQVDYLFALTEDGTKYFIPSYAIDGDKQIILGDKYSEYIVV